MNITMKKIVLVDMDGVLANVYRQFIHLEYKATGVKLDYDSLNGIIEEKAFPHFERDVNSRDFFRTAPLMTDSVEGLKYLNDKYTVYIVSSATEFPNSLPEKQQWLNEHFPFISWRQMIFCGSKKPITGDIMIDDHPSNLDSFEGRKILFTQPHNVYDTKEGYTRVKGWQEIMVIL